MDVEFFSDDLKYKYALALILTFKKNGIFTWWVTICKFPGTPLATLEALSIKSQTPWGERRIVKDSFQGSLKNQDLSVAMLLLLCIVSSMDRHSHIHFAWWKDSPCLQKGCYQDTFSAPAQMFLSPHCACSGLKLKS